MTGCGINACRFPPVIRPTSNTTFSSKEATVPHRRTITTLLSLFVFALGASTSLRASPPIGAVVHLLFPTFGAWAQNPPDDKDRQRKPSRHSGLPVVGEFERPH